MQLGAVVLACHKCAQLLLLLVQLLQPSSSSSRSPLYLTAQGEGLSACCMKNEIDKLQVNNKNAASLHQRRLPASVSNLHSYKFQHMRLSCGN